MSSDNIKVAIKVRPLLKKEKDLKSLWKVVDNSIQHIDSQNEPFYFDHIFDQDALNQNIFDIVAKPIIDATLRGINGTIFAYGQTSSGKTYTMLGNEENPGVMALAIKEIIRKIESMKEREFLVRVGYIEIYNEKIYDLLNKKNQDLKIHETANGDITVNCSEYVITCEEEMMEYLYEGSKQRKIGETNMNERSSRSHTIFRIIIESREIGKSADDDCIQISNLNLVDLAGSERADQTGATGNRLKEGGHINRSLLSLSRVINKLSENESDKHINYRDSKLTRILQASLGGNALTAIICNIKPTALEETMSTLNFALRAKSIKNKPKVNAVLSDAAMMKKLQREITKLQAELEIEKSKNSKMKILQLEKQIKEEELKIMSSCSANRNKKISVRRRTWCSTLSTDQEEDNLKTNTPTEVKNEHNFMNVFLTPLITIRDQTYNNNLDCFPSNKDDVNLWSMDKETCTVTDNIDEFKCSLDTKSNSQENLKYSTPSPSVILTKYKQLKDDYEQLKLFTEKEQISKDEFYRKEKQLEYLQEKCNNLEQHINDLNENLNKSKEKEKCYEDQLDSALKEIHKLEIALKDADSFQFQYELDKERLKRREEELLEALIQRQQTIESLKKMHSSSSSYIEKLDKEIMVCLEEQKQHHEQQQHHIATQSTMILNENMNELLKEKDEKIEKLREENRKLLNEYDELSNQMIESIQENDNLKDNNSKLTEQLNAYQNELEKLNNFIVKKYNSEYYDTVENGNDLEKSISKAVVIIEKILHEKDQTIEKLQEEIEYLKRTNEENLNNLKILNSKLENQYDNDDQKCSKDINDHINCQLKNEMTEKSLFNKDSQIISCVSDLAVSSSCPITFASSEDFEKFEKLKNYFESITIENEKIETYNKELQNDLNALKIEFINEEKNLKNEINILQNEIKSIKNEENLIEMKISEIIKFNEDLKILINEYKLKKLNDDNRFISKIEELHLEIDSCKQENNDLKMKNGNYEKVLNELKCEIENIKSNTELEKNNLEMKINEISKENEENEKINSELQKRIEQLQKEIDNLQEENSNIKNRKDQIEEMNKKLQEHLQNFEGTDEENEKINNELQECIKELRQEIDSLQRENSCIKDKKDQIESMNWKLKEHLKEYERNDEENEKINNELQKCVTELRKEIDSLRTENICIKDKKEQIESMNKKLQERLKEYEIQKTEKMECPLAFDNMEDTLIMKKDQMEKINKELQQSTEKYDNKDDENREKYIQNLKNIKDDFITDLQEKYNQCETKCNDLLLKIDELTMKNKLLEEDNIQLKQNIDEISKNLELLKNEKNDLEHLTNLIKDNRQTEIEKMKLLENDKNYYQERLEMNRKENNELQERLRKDNILMKQLQDECKILKTSTEELMGNIIKIEKEKNSLEAENMKLKVQIENHIEQNQDDLENLKITFKENLMKNENEIKSLNEEISYLKKEIEKYKEEADEYRNRVNGLENKLQAQIDENKITCTNMKIYETKISELNSQLELLKALNNELLDENKKLKIVQINNNEIKSLQLQLEQITNLKDSYKEQMNVLSTKLRKLDEDNTNGQLKLICLQRDNKLLENKMNCLKEMIETLQKDLNMEKNSKLKWENNFNKLSEEMKELKNKNKLLTEENMKLIEKHEQKISTQNEVLDKEVTNHCKAIMKQGNNIISKVYESTSTDKNKIHNEKNSIKSKENDRKMKRYSSHDEKRFMNLWDDHIRDVETMTDPTDKFCNCEVLDKKIKEFQRQIRIQECHINTLQMQIDCNPLLEENKKLQKYLQDALNKNNEYKIEIQLLNKKIMEIQKLKEILIDKSCQTENDEPSSTLNHENELMTQIENFKKENQKLQLKYEYGKKSWREHREDIKNKFEKLQSENELLSKKYSEVKFLLGEYKKDLKVLQSKVNSDQL